MKIIAVLLFIFGLSGIGVSAEVEGTSVIFVLLVSALAIFGGIKLWKKKPSSKKYRSKGEAEFYAELEKRKYIEQEPMNPYVDMVAFNGTEPLKPIYYDDVVLYPNEMVYYAIPGQFVDSLGMNRVMLGMGDYVLTNQRALFLSEGDSWEIPLSAINAVRTDHIDSFTIITKKLSYNIVVGDIMYGNRKKEAEFSRLATLQIIDRFMH